VQEGKRRLPRCWPFDDYRTAGIKYRLIYKGVSYQTCDEKVPKAFITETLSKDQYAKLPEPRHVTRNDPDNTHRYTSLCYAGRFEVHFKIVSEPHKARSQHIMYADDALTKRIKIILNNKKAIRPVSDMHTLGALLLALAAHHVDDLKDMDDVQTAPYPDANLKDALGTTPYRDYNKVLDFYRQKELEAADALPTIGTGCPISSTRGHQKDVQHSDVDRDGTQDKQEKPDRQTTATNKKKDQRNPSPTKDSTGTLLISRPPVKERHWSKSTRTWTQSPISHTAKVRPRSRERSNERHKERDRNRSRNRDSTEHRGGKESSESTRKSVFERLHHQERREDRHKTEDNDVETKKSRLSKSKRG
jgi:hypothetical protein